MGECPSVRLLHAVLREGGLLAEQWRIGISLAKLTIYPLVNKQFAIENGPLVDLPNYKMVIFHCYVSLPEGMLIPYITSRCGSDDGSNVYIITECPSQI